MAVLEKATDFVNRKLGTTVKPTLEIEEEPTVEYVAIRFPKQERIIAHPRFFPSDVEGQKTVLIHEVSEIAYEQKGYEEPHTKASDFTREHWEEVGGKDPEVIHKELMDKGYYHG